MYKDDDEPKYRFIPPRKPWRTPLVPQRPPRLPQRPWTKEMTERRERIAVEFQNAHVREHEKANSLSRCRFCNYWPGSNTKETS